MAISGFPELLPAQRFVELAVLDRLRQTFELHGFAPLETPAVGPQALPRDFKRELESLDARVTNNRIIRAGQCFLKTLQRASELPKPERKGRSFMAPPPWPGVERFPGTPWKSGPDPPDPR